MKRKALIMLAVLLSCLPWSNGVWADTMWYSDYRQNSGFDFGVLSVRYNSTKFGAAIYGEANQSTGEVCGGRFLSASTDGKGVLGYAIAESGKNYGGFFQSRSSKGRGVTGLASAGEGKNYGGYFQSNSINGKGVLGHAKVESGNTFGGYFRSDSTYGKGVSGYASAESGLTIGGYFLNRSTGGTGIFSRATAKSGVTYGGYFLSDSSTGGRGIFSAATATTGGSYGGEFRSESTEGKGVMGLANASSGYTYGGFFQSNSTEGRGVYGFANANSGSAVGVYGRSDSPGGYGVFSSGNMMVTRNFTVLGTKSAVVKLKNGESVSLYAVEASENWFEDFGSSKLKQGSAIVRVDPTFAETVNTDMEYHVFLTPRGECNGLYVLNQKRTSFEVKELNGGKSDISFSYRIVAKRKGFEDQRFAKVNEDKTTAMDTAEEEGEDIQESDITEFDLQDDDIALEEDLELENVEFQ